jgi:hypothetical protein
VLDPGTADSLRPLLRFRHFVWHSYTASWDGRRLAEVLSDAEHAWPQVHRDLSAFVGFLDAAIAALG